MISLSRIILSLGRWTSKTLLVHFLPGECLHRLCPQNCRTKRLCILSPFLSTTALENGIGMDTAPPSTWSLGESHNRVSSWWQSPQSQHYGLSSFQHSYYLCGIPLLSAYGSSSFFGAHIIRLDGRIVPDRAFQHNPDRDQLRQGCWYRP